MSYTYQIGIRNVVGLGASGHSGDKSTNKIEMVIKQIEGIYRRFDLPITEVCFPQEITSVGTSGELFILYWQGYDSTPMIFEASPELKADQESFLGENWSAPNSFELPGSACDILVPNVNVAQEVTHMTQLMSIRDLPELETVSHQELFGREKIKVGCLDSQIALLDAAIKEGHYPPEEIDIAQHVLEKMKLAQKYDHLFTFRY